VWCTLYNSPEVGQSSRKEEAAKCATPSKCLLSNQLPSALDSTTSYMEVNDNTTIDMMISARPMSRVCLILPPGSLSPGVKTWLIANTGTREKSLLNMLERSQLDQE